MFKKFDLILALSVLTLATATAQETGTEMQIDEIIESTSTESAGSATDFKGEAAGTSAPAEGAGTQAGQPAGEPAGEKAGADAAVPAGTADELAPPSPLPTETDGGTMEEDDVFDLAEPAPIDPPSDVFADPGMAGEAPMGTDLEMAGGEPLDLAPGSTTMDFQEEDLPQVLRLLARQAKVNLYVSDAVVGTLTLRVQDKSPLETLKFIAQAKGLVLDEIEGDYFVKTQAEKASEPTESGSYQFSYASAGEVKDLLQSQLSSGVPAQVDSRTNTVFYREVRSNMENIALFLETIDKPTKQVMIEARLVEVNANPRQNYGINWAGTLLNQTIGLSGSQLDRTTTELFTDNLTVGGDSAFLSGQNAGTGDGSVEITSGAGAGLPEFTGDGNVNVGGDATSGGRSVLNSDAITDSITNTVASAAGGFLLDPTNLFSTIGGQYAVLSAPQLSATLSLINQDTDSEFLAQPRIVTADNQEATIKITRNQPVPQLNFNEQTATAVFGGFEDKEFGNTLSVRPSINKDNFVTLNVKPEVSNKVGDATFTFAGATVASPIIDTRTLESNILIKSGNTLAIGGLLQDEENKGTTKVPVLGDIPVLGYLFQSKETERVKRNLLVFITPTILEHGQGTGLEDQVNGLHDSGEEFADPTGWRNNAKGAMRLVPTSNRQIAADYPKPGTPLAPEAIQYKANAPSRE